MTAAAPIITTAPISMLYGLHEALRLIHEEGLPPRFIRHQLNSDALLAGLEPLGLRPLPPAAHRLPHAQLCHPARGIDDTLVRTQLLQDHGIEIGGGLGPLRGRVWRIGLMGESLSAGARADAAQRPWRRHFRAERLAGSARSRGAGGGRNLYPITVVGEEGA